MNQVVQDDLVTFMRYLYSSSRAMSILPTLRAQPGSKPRLPERLLAQTEAIRVLAVDQMGGGRAWQKRPAAIFDKSR
jgi:hypothetical protein